MPFINSAKTECDEYLFFDRIRIPNTIRFSEISEYRILNTIRYWENPNTKYRILFVIKKIQIPNTNSTFRSNYSNTKYLIQNSIQNFWNNETKIKIFLPYKTFCSENMWSYWEYRILFGIGKIWIPNTNTTIQSNYLNSIRIPNYSSHPARKAFFCLKEKNKPWSKAKALRMS